MSVADMISAARERVEHLSPDQVAAELDSPEVVLVDVREPGEQLTDGTIPGALTAPRGMLEFHADPASPYHLDGARARPPGDRALQVRRPLRAGRGHPRGHGLHPRRPPRRRDHRVAGVRPPGHDAGPVTGPGAGFLDVPPTTDDVRRLYEEDVEELGYVMNASRVWAHRPDTQDDLFALMRRAVHPLGLDARRRALLVVACASARGDSYCALAWGGRLAAATDPDLAAAVLRGDDSGLDATERALTGWARAVARDPNGTTAADVRALREAGFSDADILAITVFVALRLAFSTVNDALGARPDAELAAGVPPRCARPWRSAGRWPAEVGRHRAPALLSWAGDRRVRRRSGRRRSRPAPTAGWPGSPTWSPTWPASGA